MCDRVPPTCVTWAVQEYECGLLQRYGVWEQILPSTSNHTHQGATAARSNIEPLYRRCYSDGIKYTGCQ